MREALLLTLALLPATAQAWTEPPRGSDLRRDLMDAIRPQAEWDLGAPVEFVIHELRVEGDVAFASVHAQRPGGVEIDPNTIPGVRREDFNLEIQNPVEIQALYQRSGRQWVATHYVAGATDVWWAWQEYCPIWAPVIPDVCDNK